MSRRWKSQLALQAGVLTAAAVLLGALACPGAAQAQTPKLARIGPQTVGSRLAEVSRYRRTSSDCRVDKVEADCVFIAPNGVEYVVMGSAVTEVIATEKSVHGELALPFGLKLGERMGTALAKLTSQGRRWSLGTPEQEPKEGVVYLSSEDVYQGENGSAFGVDIYFDHERLVRVDYDSGLAN